MPPGKRKKKANGVRRSRDRVARRPQARQPRGTALPEGEFFAAVGRGAQRGAHAAPAEGGDHHNPPPPLLFFGRARGGAPPANRPGGAAFRGSPSMIFSGLSQAGLAREGGSEAEMFASSDVRRAPSFRSRRPKRHARECWSPRGISGWYDTAGTKRAPRATSDRPRPAAAPARISCGGGGGGGGAPRRHSRWARRSISRSGEHRGRLSPAARFEAPSRSFLPLERWLQRHNNATKEPPDR